MLNEKATLWSYRGAVRAFDASIDRYIPELEALATHPLRTFS